MLLLTSFKAKPLRLATSAPFPVRVRLEEGASLLALLPGEVVLLALAGLFASGEVRGGGSGRS